MPCRPIVGCGLGVAFQQASMSLSRNGEGSMALNNCFNSPTCTSMTEHLGGIGSPEEALSLVPEAYVITLARLLQSEVYPVASPDPTCRGRSPVRHYCHGFPAGHATMLVLRCPRHSWGNPAPVTAPTLLQLA